MRNDRWLPAIIVAVLVGAMFYALHADLSQPVPQIGYRSPQNVQQPKTNAEKADAPQNISRPTTPTQDQFVGSPPNSSNGQAQKNDTGEKSSDWLILLFNGILAVVAVIQARLLFITFKANRINARATVRAARAAERAANATVAAAAAATTANSLQLRPYLFPEHFQIHEMEGGRHEVRTNLRNSGTTPAINVVIDMDVQFAFFPLKIRTFDLRPTEHRPRVHHWAIASNDRREVGRPIHIDPGTVSEIRQLQKAILCVLRYTYEIHDGQSITGPSVNMIATGMYFMSRPMSVISDAHYTQEGETDDERRRRFDTWSGGG